jgi:hypothetical protein
MPAIYLELLFVSLTYKSPEQNHPVQSEGFVSVCFPEVALHLNPQTTRSPGACKRTARQAAGLQKAFLWWQQLRFVDTWGQCWQRIRGCCLSRAPAG